METTSLQQQPSLSSTDDTLAAARTLLEEARQHFHTADIPQSLAKAGDAVRLLQSSAASIGSTLRRIHTLVRCMLLMVRCHQRLQEFEQAERHLREVLSLCEETKDEAGTAEALDLLGNQQGWKGENAAALDNLLSSLTLYRNFGNTAAEQRVLSTIGLVYGKLGDFAEALDYTLRSFDLARSLGNAEAENRCIGNIAVIYCQSGDHSSALDYFFRSLEYHRSNDDRANICQTLHNIGVVYAHLKDHDKAIHFMQQSLELLRETKDKRSIILALCNLAESYMVLEDYDKADELVRESLVMLETMESLDGMVGPLFSYGDLLARTGKYDEAIPYLLRALQHAEATEARVPLYHVHERLYQVYRQLGDAVRALEHHEKFHTIKEEIYNEDNSRKLAALRTVHQVATSRKEAEIYRLKNVELARANEQLQAFNREKNEVMGIVAHDLKNPLSGILMLSRILHADAPGIGVDDLRDYMTDIETVVSRMFDLINNLLDSNRIETQGIAPEMVMCDVEDVLHTVVGAHRPHASTKNITIVCTKEPAVQEMSLRTDERILHQIIDNLLSNAVKFSYPDSTVHTRLIQSDLALCIEIQDEGPGLTQDDLQHLFKKFARLSARPTGNEHSTGLGLSIVKKLVEALGGTIRCESEPGKGALFIVELPVQE